MWIIEKKVGVFVHYLTLGGKFQPGIERANKFASKEMAEIMVKLHGGTIRQLNQNDRT
ncbi:MAG: hypothetical protein Tsb0014_30770 [Pleurocapsa sp.]